MAELLDVGLGAGRAGVRLSERPDPSVPQVRVINPADQPALLTAGTILRGGMQTRIVSGSVLLPTEEPVELPVSCVERGRWSGGASFELTAKVSPRPVRARPQSPPSPQIGTGAGYAAMCGGVRADAAERPESVGFAQLTRSPSTA